MISKRQLFINSLLLLLTITSSSLAARKLNSYICAVLRPNKLGEVRVTKLVPNSEKELNKLPIASVIDIGSQSSVIKALQSCRDRYLETLDNDQNKDFFANNAFVAIYKKTATSPYPIAGISLVFREFNTFAVPEDIKNASPPFSPIFFPEK